MGASALTAALNPGFSLAFQRGPIQTRAIPKSGEDLPVIGLGTAYGFGASSSEADYRQRKEVIETLLGEGGRVIDTSPSPSYGVAESVIGRALEETGARKDTFLATKISTYGKGSGESQLRNSLRYLRTTMIDLVQVHNLKDTAAHLKTIRQARDEGKVRYFGVTHYLDSGLSGLARVLKTEPVDFVQCHYSALEREAENGLLDLAQERGGAVIVNRPFARGEVFRAVRGQPVPAWAAEELAIESWGQFFLKFCLSHPAVTVAVPGTDKPHHMADNIGAAYGPLPDDGQRARMIRFLETL